MDTFDLTPFCRTKSEAQTFASQLSTLSEMVYRTDFQFDTALAEVFNLQKKEAFLTLLRSENTTFKTPADFKNFLAGLITQVTSLPVLSLTIAFEPTETTLRVLTDWFLMQSKRHVLFDITVDRSLIAGVAIRYNGKYVEYSIKPTVSRIIKETLTSYKPHETKRAPNLPNHQAIESVSLGR